MVAAGTRFGFGARAPFKMPDGAPRLVPVFYWKGEPYPVILPSIRDPRLHFAAIIWGLQIMGQVWLRFETTPALIISTIFVAAIFASGQKYIIKLRGEQVFNPSALAIFTLLVLFPQYVHPTPLTWGVSWGGQLFLVLYLAIGVYYVLRSFRLTLIPFTFLAKGPQHVV